MAARAVVFLTSNPDGPAKVAAAEFTAAAAKWKLTFQANVTAHADLSAGEADTARLLVIWNDVGTPLPTVVQSGSLTTYLWDNNRPNSEQCASLIALLLGGSAGVAENKASTIPPPKPPKPKGTVKLSRETAGRRGKGVTVVSDLPLTLAAIEELAGQLKAKCGTGGTVKDARIEIQGDHRDRLQTELEKLGYKVKRSGG